MAQQGAGGAGTGGSVAATGGKTETGGPTGTGGGALASGGAGTAGGTTGAAGNTGTGAVGSGGLSVGGGGLPGGGGAGAGSGAGGTTTGTAGTSVISGCAGIPLTPDAKGYISLASNPLAVRGSWFIYSDCVDLKGVNCAMVTSPSPNSFPNVGGKMCTSGKTSMAAGAWGAGIGLELNDGPPQMPYDTVAHGIKGFCFQLSGPTIPSSSIRVAFPTKNVPDDVYFSAVTTPGQHTVMFADTAQGSWVTKKSAFEPTMVMLLQLQIPSTTTAPVAWDFCIEGLTAIMQ